MAALALGPAGPPSQKVAKQSLLQRPECQGNPLLFLLVTEPPVEGDSHLQRRYTQEQPRLQTLIFTVISKCPECWVWVRDLMCPA